MKNRDRRVRTPEEALRKKTRPESIVSTYGYDPQRSEGALVPPIFLSSTFVFSTAEEGERAFKIAYHLTEDSIPVHSPLIYTRLNNPNLEILEERLTLFEPGTEQCAVFSSGMSAIATTILSLVQTGGSVLYSAPVYGGTDYLFNHILPGLGIRTEPFHAGIDPQGIRSALHRILRSTRGACLVFLETPANPTCTLTDIAETRRAIDEVQHGRKQPIYLAVDNTFLGPMWQHPAKLGADLVIYSATKFIGGHSDVVAGAVLGSKKLIADHVKVTRTILGTVPSPFDGYLLLRSLDTLKMRMTSELKNAKHVAEWLAKEPHVESVCYPGLLPEGHPQRTILEKQCVEPGSMVTFYIRGGKKQAFKFLNALKLVKLAVSLGSTKTLAEHPATMTHSDIDPKERLALGIDDRMIRLSIGTEHYKDIIADLDRAFREL
ncbi:MAG: PLP-dependent transferase [Candidatus Thermoplasmatota archaeon]|jgi:methionine-gamma-lyase|nr:PLP-dependent transferase [Candidatus Thermoplasmatota archaeon]MCL5984699.1 PLP-dependent transferase [Candidatus Thermoplasmatota archaeon]